MKKNISLVLSSFMKGCKFPYIFYFFSLYFIQMKINDNICLFYLSNFCSYSVRIIDYSEEISSLTSIKTFDSNFRNINFLYIYLEWRIRYFLPIIFNLNGMCALVPGWKCGFITIRNLFGFKLYCTTFRIGHAQFARSVFLWRLSCINKNWTFFSRGDSYNMKSRQDLSSVFIADDFSSIYLIFQAKNNIIFRKKKKV